MFLFKIATEHKYNSKTRFLTSKNGLQITCLQKSLELKNFLKITLPLSFEWSPKRKVHELGFILIFFWFLASSTLL